MLGTRLFCISSVNVISRRKFSTGPSAKTRLNRKRPKAKAKRNADTEPTVITEWTEQQKQVISAVQDGKSVFISGSAGTGKTLLVKHVIKLLKKQYKPSGVFVTASTGVAACALRGQTLHSFAGVGPMGEREAFLERVWSNGKALRRWMRVRALVIDEISMVDGQLFEILERIARIIRGGNSAWGGIQLIASGDFFQLPPVLDNDVLGDKKEFAFEADCWSFSFGLQVELEKVYRQSDPKLIELLQGIRRGECSDEGQKIIQRNCCMSVPDSSVVELYPRNSDVMRVNMERMNSLGKEKFVFKAVDTGKEPWKSELKKGIAPDEICLCEGARVMLIKNLNTRLKLVNGATGTVVGFHERKYDADPSFDVEFGAVCQDGLVPEVKFDHGRTVAFEPETWVVVEGNKVVAERTQIPLILAWSVSIHKCQGMTLDRLRTNLSNAFGFGMVYVALSRVRTLDGLYLSGFRPSKVKAHPKVVRFYENLDREQRRGGGDDILEQKEDIRSHLAREQSKDVGDDISDHKEDTGGKPLVTPCRSSIDRPKFHFSLTEYLASRQVK